MEHHVMGLIITGAFTTAMVLLVYFFIGSVDRRDTRFTEALKKVSDLVEINRVAVEKLVDITEEQKRSLSALVKEVALKASK